MAIYKHIFLSYATGDASDFVQRLHDDLETSGYDAWLDKFNIQAGEDWDKAIDNALRAAWAVCVVLSPGAVASLQVKAEWNDALDRYIPIIPLWVKSCEVPRVLKLLNWINFADDYHRGLAALRQRLSVLPLEHLVDLDHKLKAFETAQENASDVRSFSGKVDSVKSAIMTWRNHFNILDKSSQKTLSSPTGTERLEGKSMVAFRRLLLKVADIDSDG